MSNFKIDIFLSNNKAKEFKLSKKINTLLELSNQNIPLLILNTTTEIAIIKDIYEFINDVPIDKIIVYVSTLKKDNAIAVFNKDGKFDLNLKMEINENFTQIRFFYN